MMFKLARFQPPLRMPALMPVCCVALAMLAQHHARADDLASPAAFSTQVVELPQQMPVIPVCPPTEPYVLPGDPNAPVVIDNQIGLPAPVAPTDSLVTFLRAALGPPVQAYGTYIPRNGNTAVGMDEFNVSATLPIPFPGEKWAFLVTPYSQLRLLDGPVTPDLPPRLIDANLAVSLVGELPYNFLLDAGAVPGYHSDGDNNTAASYRVPFFGVLGYRVSPTLLVALGFADLDRRDVTYIPVGGLIWLPDDNTRIDLIPPKPKIAHRFQVGQGFERWWYFAAEFGGEQWAIRREGGADDVLTYRDYRVINGIEQRSTTGGLGGFFEYGYVFGRRFEYSSGTPSFEPHSTLMARLGLQF